MKLKILLPLASLLISLVSLFSFNIAYASPNSAVGALKPSSIAGDLFGNSKNEACNGVGLGTNGCTDANNATNKANSLISTIVNILTAVVGIIAVVIIIVSGLKFITSGGDSQAVASAKNSLLYALAGIVVVALAQVIVRFVLRNT